MYDIRQFKPTLYAVVLLGFLGYAIAMRSPMIFLFAALLTIPNAMLVYSGRFVPLGRWTANLITVGTFFYVISLFRTGQGQAISAVGQFLVFLQLVKLYEQRALRDYGQLLVLSLLLMVAGAMGTASMFFGVLFIIYLFVSLYCCLLFHLVVETEYAKTSLTLPAEKINPQILRQDQQYLSRSMQKLTGLVALVSIASGVLVFLFFPRGPGSGLLAQLQFQPKNSMTGFSDEVNFQKVAAIAQNTEEVGIVKVTRDEVPYISTSSLYFRGRTLDTYTGNDDTRGRWRWIRTADGSDLLRAINAGGRFQFRQPIPHQLSQQEWRLKYSGTPTLFALPGLSQMTAPRDAQVRHSLRDDVFANELTSIGEYRYTVWSDGEANVDMDLLDRQRKHALLVPSDASYINPKIGEYARRAEVTRGLWKDRPITLLTDERDEKIADAIQSHLQSKFSYTLDLTSSVTLGNDDPLVRFLYDFKKGHCEYFAGAMTLLCQSLGLTARMVTGYRVEASDYNNFGSFYTVRNSHAHAWVEVLTPDGWRTYDPTSGSTEAMRAAAKPSMLARFQKYMDYLQYVYTNNVIAYDNENRQSLLMEVNAGMANRVYQSSNVVKDLMKLLDPDRYPMIWNDMIGIILLVMITIGAFAVGWFIFERWRLRRRAARLGVESLSPRDQIRLARQLEFYDQMLRSLARRHIVPRPQQTPLEFCRSLSYLPADAFETMSRLTSIFYRIRYGQTDISAQRQKWLLRAAAKLETRLPARLR